MLYGNNIVIVQRFFSSYPSCNGALAPGLAADMHFLSDVIAFIGPACLFALEPVARLAAYWNTPIITGMGDQASYFYMTTICNNNIVFAGFINCSSTSSCSNIYPDNYSSRHPKGNYLWRLGFWEDTHQITRTIQR